MKIKIKDYDYTIIEVDDKTDTEFWNDKDKGRELQLFGCCNDITCEIKIWKDLSDIQKRKTLMHELTHAFLFVYWGSYNIKQRFDSEDMCSFMETYGEDIVRMTNEYMLATTTAFKNKKNKEIKE